MSRHFVKRTGLIRRKEKTIRAVTEVSLEIKEGETLGLVGESGCGKTTLGQTIAGLIDPSDGKIRLDIGGQMREISNLSEQERRNAWHHIRFVFQDPFVSLSPRLSVGQIIEEGLLVHNLAPDAQGRRELIARALEEVGLEPQMQERYPHEFSGGQAQRVCIARALLSKPKLLVLDEPVSALDVSVQAEILKLLDKMRKELGLTYLFISHDLAVVEQICS